MFQSRFVLLELRMAVSSRRCRHLPIPQSEVRKIWQMGPLGYPFLYETHLPNFTESPSLRWQWHGLTAVSDRFTSYPM